MATLHLSSHAPASRISYLLVALAVEDTTTQTQTLLLEKKP
jgi:hypothetical protein